MIIILRKQLFSPESAEGIVRPRNPHPGVPFAVEKLQVLDDKFNVHEPARALLDVIMRRALFSDFLLHPCAHGADIGGKGRPVGVLVDDVLDGPCNSAPTARSPATRRALRSACRSHVSAWVV